MITANQIKTGINQGVIQFDIDPNMGSGTVCRIGDSWFYFGGETAESLNPQEYLNNIPMEDIVQEIWETLDDFSKSGECFIDEYHYYESILQTETTDTEYDRGYRKALEDINTPMQIIARQWNPSQCPRCRRDFSEFEPCDDGYYNRVVTMPRCPFCGQLLDWGKVTD